MEYKKSKSNKENFFEGTFLLLNKKYSDGRVFFLGGWNSKTFSDIDKQPIKFVQDNHSKSKNYVIRGLHYQIFPKDQGKLTRYISGKIFDILVDLRKSSKNFLKWTGAFLNDKDHKQLWIPSGFSYGFLALCESSEIIYKTNSIK